MSESTVRRWKTKHESGQLVSSKEKMGKVNEKKIHCSLSAHAQAIKTYLDQHPGATSADVRDFLVIALKV
jgi:hypothetical protein